MKERLQKILSARGAASRRKAEELIRAGRFKKGNVLYAEAGDVAALKRHIRRYGKPDAFVCSNDARAAEFKQTLEKAGLSVPQDIRLAAFDDVQIAGLLTPPLTTIHQPCVQIAQTAVEVLMRRIRKPESAALTLLLDAPLVVRESTG